ncbi:hypothetical protein [Clostridium thermarum]|uniref:hypothetical protein n=1 Tax=Clostridium thermarum TaxID=1716543 RepID=UPI0013D6C387|nr:hypothetical protein [Clostridium thermarum]
MKLSKYDYLMLCILGIVIIFTISFNIAMRVLSKNSLSYEEKNEKVTSARIIEKVLSDDTVIVLKLKNKDNEINTKNVSVKEVKNFLSGDLTVSKLKDYYERKDYKLIQETNFELIFEKETRFTPQKYYLGATNKEFVAIFKCDNEGNLFIEDPDYDISNRTLETLPEQYQESLINFEFEFETKEEAQDEMMAISS